jgi:hypothetical protein
MEELKHLKAFNKKYSLNPIALKIILQQKAKRRKENVLEE